MVYHVPTGTGTATARRRKMVLAVKGLQCNVVVRHFAGKDDGMYKFLRVWWAREDDKARFTGSSRDQKQLRYRIRRCAVIINYYIR